MIELLKYTTSGFVFSVGLSPPIAAAATTAIELMSKETWRLAKLRENGQAFLKAAPDVVAGDIDLRQFSMVSASAPPRA